MKGDFDMFSYHQFDHGQTPPLEYLPGKEGESFAVGEALAMGADGALTKCGAGAAPAYVCMGPAGEFGRVPCSRVDGSIVYDAPLTADGAALHLGDKVTISDDGMGVTATTADGVAEVVRIDGTGVGDTLGVRF